MPFLDIFGKKKTKPRKEKEKPKIIVDYREKSSLICSEIVSLGMEIEFKELKVADYIVKDTAIERKTINDFISSMINKRLTKQLDELQQYKKRLLMIEGIEEQDIYNDEIGIGVHPNAIRGFILSILLKYNVPIVYTKDYKDSAKFIAVLAKKEEKELSLNVTKKNLNKKERLQFILEGFPGIGPKNARKLLKKFKTIPKIINASDEELKEILGKKSESIINIRGWKY